MPPASPAPVLAAIDFSPITADVISTAVKLAKSRGTRLILEHVVMIPPAAVNIEMAGTDATPIISETIKHAEQLMAAAARRVNEVPLETRCQVGVPSLEICRGAREMGTDCIVVGSHGHGALYELLIGTTTQGILRQASCPVLVVPAANKPVRPAAIS